MSIPECGKRETCRNYDVRCADCWATSNIYDTHPFYTTKDLVEVVRCKDCGFIKETKISINKRPLRSCTLYKKPCYDDDFCSRGVRKGEKDV